MTYAAEKAVKNVVDLGVFALLSKELRVTDPCYSPDTWCAGKFAAAPGIWRSKAVRADSGWGERVWELVIEHVETDSSELPEERLDITVGVDSGQAGFFCAETYAQVQKSKCGEPGFYGMACALTCETVNSAGVLGFGVVSSSGFGDGSYECLVKKDRAGRVVAARIIFITEDDLVDDEDEED